MRLLRTKTFVPHVHPDLVPRERLRQCLDAARLSRLALLSAPAGFGKTTILCDWIQRRGLRVAWVSLDAGDNDPSRFWAYVALALGALHPHLGEAALRLLQTPHPPATETILTDLINEMTVVLDPAFLVLDDYHVIESPTIHEALAFLLRNMPPQMHIIVASRQDPPLALASLRTRRELIELRAHDLRFTHEETATLLQRVMGLELSRENLAALETRIEGWAAGLQLAALSMQGERDIVGFIRAFTGSHRYVFDYLAQEVLAHQPEAIRAFLLQTAILERLSGPLADALTGSDDGQAMLRHIEEANLFIMPLDQGRQWYRYHPLFADFLHTRLRQTYGVEHVLALHRRASAWFAAHDWIEEAIHHALSAGDDATAVRLIEQVVVSMFQRGELVTLSSWLEALSSELLEQHPRLCAASAWALLATGHSEQAESRLCLLETAVGATADILASEQAAHLPPEVRGVLVEITTLRASVAVNALDIPRTLELSERALPYIVDSQPTRGFNPPDLLRPVILFNLALAREFTGDVAGAIQACEEAAVYGREYRNAHILPLALSHLAQMLIVQGKLHRAAETYRLALQQSQAMAGHLSPLVGVAHAGLGSLLYEWNDLSAAQTEFEEAIALGMPWNNGESVVPGYLGLARIRQAHGEPAEATRLLDELISLLDTFDTPTVMPQMETFQAGLAVIQGKAERAIAWAESLGLDSSNPIPYLRETDAITWARVRLAQGHAAQVRHILEHLLAEAEAGQRTGRAIEILVVLALALRTQGHMAEALEALDRALALAEPEGYVRTFVDQGEGLEHLLGQIASSGVARGYATQLLAAFQPNENDIPTPSDGSTAHQSLAESLTEREVEVLQLIAEGLTNQGIADHLTVSLNTVKTHVKNIYGKLEVRNRPQAIAHARQLGLL